MNLTKVKEAHHVPTPTENPENRTYKSLRVGDQEKQQHSLQWIPQHVFAPPFACETQLASLSLCIVGT